MKTPLIDAVLDRAHDAQAAHDRDLASGKITEDEWYALNQGLIVGAYLAATNPRAQSGHSGDEARWKEARGDLALAIDRPGTFLDVGCANGHLMESAVLWAAARGHAIEPYGLDLSPELANLARQRLPAWQDRIFVGNALDWIPPHRFDFVHVMELSCVPVGRRQALFEHLLLDVCAPGGRLILGPANERAEVRSAEDQVRSFHWPIAGSAERPHSDPRAMRRVLWVDAPRRVLFLCSGNYFRSRYAECLFNQLATQRRLPFRAESRGLAVVPGKNPGPISRATAGRLTAKGHVGPWLTRMPVQVTEAELAAASHIVALKEEEHRPLMRRLHPRFEDQVEYWAVDDIDCCTPDQALDAIEPLVDCLISRQ